MSPVNASRFGFARTAAADFLVVAAPALVLALLGGFWMGAKEALVNDYFVAGYRSLAISAFRTEFDRNITVAIVGAATAAALVALLRALRFRATPLLCAAVLAVIVLVSVSISFTETWRVADYRALWDTSFPRAFKRDLLGKLTLLLAAISLIALWVSRPRSSPPRDGGGSGGSGGRFHHFGRGALVLAGLFWAASHAIVPLITEHASAPYPVIYIAWDSVRADFVSGYGHAHETTPNLDEFARDAVLFEQTVSPANWTRPAFMNIMTSVPFWKLGELGSQSGAPYLTLAEMLKNRGYRTIGFAQNPNLDAQLGFRQGFDEYIHVYTSQAPELMNSLVVPLLAELRDPGQPFFLFVHYQEPHWPYRGDNIPSAPTTAPILDEEAVAALMNRDFQWDPSSAESAEQLEFLHQSYDADIRATDEALGEILAALKESGLWDQALVIINSDHGDEFYEHGSFGHAHANLHPELTFVPQVIKFPAPLQVPAGRVGELVETQDIVPTILSVLGIEAPPQIEGLSLFPLDKLPDKRRIALSAFNDLLMLRSEAESLLVTAGDGPDQRYFDRTVDPQELNSLAWDPEDPGFTNLREAAAPYVEQWLRLYRAGEGGRGSENEGLDPDLRRRLKALGYIR